MRMMSDSLHRVAICIKVALMFGVCVLICLRSESGADEPSVASESASSASGTRNSQYSPEVVEKAETILAKVGLKRSGKIIQSVDTASISRSLSSLNRTSRELRLVSTDWKSAVERVAKIKQELKRLNVQDGEHDHASISVNDNEVWANAASGAENGWVHHQDREWMLVDLDITEFAAEQSDVQVSWKLESDGELNLGGWNIDDVCVYGELLPDDTTSESTSDSTSDSASDSASDSNSDSKSDDGSSDATGSAGR